MGTGQDPTRPKVGWGSLPKFGRRLTAAKEGTTNNGRIAQLFPDPKPGSRTPEPPGRSGLRPGGNGRGPQVSDGMSGDALGPSAGRLQRAAVGACKARK